MIKKIKNIFSRQFVRNILIVMTGTATVQLITFVSTPIITRIFGPEAYGVMGTFVAIVSILGPLVALTYPIAIVLPEDDDDARLIGNLSFIITIFISVLTLLVSLVLHDFLTEKLNLGNTEWILYLIPIYIFFTGYLQIMEQWLTRTKQFNLKVKVKISNSLFMNISKIIVGLFAPFGVVLIVINTIAIFLNAVRINFAILKSKRILSIHSFNFWIANFNKMLNVGKKHYDFPLYRAPQTLLNGISKSFPIVMLSSIFGPSSAGFYTLGNSVLAIPVNLIGKSVGDVFYPKITEAGHNNKRLTPLILKATSGLSMLGLIPFGLVIFFGPELFSFVFGSDWYIAGEYARWTALWSFFKFINQPCVQSMPILSLQKFHLIYTIIRLIVTLGGMLVAYILTNNDIITVMVFGILSSIMYIVYIVFTLIVATRSDLKQERNS